MIALLAAAALGAAPQAVPFEVLSVGLDLRILTVAYESGPCWQGDAEVGLGEDRRSITLAVAAHASTAARSRRSTAGSGCA